MVHRQKVIGHYIVDFYIAEAKIVIELDGSQHFDDEGKQKDFERDVLLSHIYIKTKRENLHCLDNNIFVVFDIETTGLNCNSEKVDKIIEIGAVKIKNGEIQDAFSTFVACDEPLSPTIIEITGNKDEHRE
jgi:very-short-patch-repair endonuclease